MNQVLLILLLVSVLGSRGKSALNTSHGSRSFNHLTWKNDGKPQTNVAKDELLGQGSPTASTPVSREDRDPIESSETNAYDRFEKPSSGQSNDSEEDEEDEEPEGPPDHAIPRSDHEEPRNVSTKPRYTAPGDWVRAAKGKAVVMDFVPTRVYAQVRKTDTLRRLPRKKAIENAVSDEEKENAARLRAVVKNTKVNTVYTEEGYEDSAYDHAGHIRDADFQEDYARKLHDQVDLRKKSGDNDYDDEREENETRDRGHKKIPSEKFKDLDELDTGRRDASTGFEANDDVAVNAKLIAEKGTEKLQADLEKEAEEMEKGIEISKVEKVRKTNDRGALAESTKRRRKTGRRQRGPSASNDIENSTAVSTNGDEVPTDSEIKTTAWKEKLEGSRGSSELYGVHGNASYNNSTDFQQTEVDPTTVSYGQIFWDYFKAKDDHTTTDLPALLETTTLKRNLLQDPSFRGTVNNLIPHSTYEETTTPFSTIESEYSSAQQSDDQPPMDSEYSKSIDENSQLVSDSMNMDELWPSINSNEAVRTETSPFSDNNHDDELYRPIEEVSMPNLEAALKSDEEFDKNFDSSLSDPTLNSLANRRPRYKITIRHKASKPEKASSSSETPNREASEPKLTIKPSIESTTAGLPTMSENYMKVLLHVKNEKNSGKSPHPQNSLHWSNAHASNHKNELEDLTIMRPPLPQKAPYYYGFYPRSQPEVDGPQLDWSSFPVPQRHHRAFTAPRIYQIYPDSPHPVQRVPFNRKRNSIPGFDLIRLPPRSDQTIWRREPIDYVSRSGNRSKQTRNVLRPFRQASTLDGVRGMRGKRRERRSAAQAVDDEGDADVVKGPGSTANNGTSNAGEIERAAKNPRIERNCSQKVTRSLEVGRALDTLAKQPGEKKSRYCATDRGEGSRAVERESSRVDGAEGSDGDVDDFAPLSYDAGKREGGNVIDSTGMKKKPGDSGVKDQLDERQTLLDEAPKVATSVIDGEIDARFNGDEEDEEDDEDDEEENVEVEVPEFDYVEELIEEDRAEGDVVSTEASLDLGKYPFYDNEKLPTPSALKYASDPKRLPAKTFGAMEFYNSRDAYKHCDEVEPKLEVLPKEEEPVAERGPKENLPRLRGLGDKLDCFKAKYFDDDPFDNPLFLEKEVEDPVAPSEIDSKKFTSRIMMFPKENDDFVVQMSSKRPENYRQPRRRGSARPQGRRRVRYKSYPRTTSRPRKRPQSYRVTSQMKNAKGSRRPQKNEKNLKDERNEKRPVTSASELSSLYTPYQSQVYEDVMGTIKNLANSYQVHEITTMPASEEIIIDDDSNHVFRTNSSKNSTKEGRKDKHRVSIDILGQPSNVGINIKGLMPPTYRSRQRGSYKRARVPQKTRPRIQKPIGYRTINRRRKVRVYKRDLTDALNSSNEESLLLTSMELGSAEKREDDVGRFSNSRESNYELTDSQDSTIRPVTVEENSTKSDIYPTTASALRNLKPSKGIPSEISINDTPKKKEKPRKIVYTIKDRIRYSKPKEDGRKLGKFVNETRVEEVSRRKEPRYNYIRRKSSPGPTLTTTENSEFPLTTEITLSDVTTTTEGGTELPRQIVANENREAAYLIAQTKDDKLNASEKLDRSDEMNHPNEPMANETATGYAVHENVNEGEVTATENPRVSSSTEYFSLKTFFEADPTKFAGLPSEDFEKPYPYSVRNNSRDFDRVPDSINSNATQQETDKDEETSKTSYPSRFSDEESSGKLETSTKAQPSRESSEESNAPSKESESDEDEPIFASRPASPAENYEDERYAGLGPRVNKPAFFHPPFADYNKSAPKRSSEEGEESTEVKEEYVFPWYKDKQDQRSKRNRYRGKSAGFYEFPWQRRQRLAREETRRKEEKRKGFLTSFDDDEEETEEAYASKPRRNTYPRGRYRYWGRRDSEGDTSDNLESSSEYRPVMKFSSRYRSKSSGPLNETSTTDRSSSVGEISRSIKKTLEGDSGEKESSKGASKEEEIDSSLEKRRESSGYRGISRGMIVPEDVTLAPARKTKNRDQSKAKGGVDTFESRNSSELAKNTLENSESRTIAATPGPREAENSTKLMTKKRRRPLKNAISTVETVTEVSRARRRNKSATTTPTTIASVGTTPASRLARRRNLKSGSELKRNSSAKVSSGSSSDASKRDGSTSKTGTVEQRSRGRKRSRTNEIVNEPTKNSRDRARSKSSRKQDHSGKVNDDGGKDLGEKEADRTAAVKWIDDHASKNEEAGESRRIIPTVKSDERFDFEDDRIGTLSDIEKPDEDYEFGAVLKTEANFSPQNRALQLTEQSSREIVSSVSWISENYDF